MNAHCSWTRVIGVAAAALLQTLTGEAHREFQTPGATEQRSADGDVFTFRFVEGQSETFVTTFTTDISMEIDVAGQSVDTTMQLTLRSTATLTPTGPAKDGVTALRFEPDAFEGEWNITAPGAHVHVTLSGADVFGTRNGVTIIDTENGIGLAEAKELKQEIMPMYLSGEIYMDEDGTSEFRGDLPFTEFWNENVQVYGPGFFGIVFPDRPLSPGDSWDVEVVLDKMKNIRLGGDGLTRLTRYERGADEDDTAMFSVSANLQETSLAGVMSERGQDIQVQIPKLAFETTGTIAFDATSGVLQESHGTSHATIMTEANSPDGSSIQTTMEIEGDYRFEHVDPDVVSSGSPIPANDAVSSISAPVTFFTPERDAILENYGPEEMVLTFPSICGHYAGTVTSEALFSPRIKAGETFTLDIGGKLADFDRVACELQEEGIQEGLEVTPSTARIACLATMAYDPSGESLGGTGFMDAKTGEPLMLIYFDRACHFKGTIERDSYVTEVDIEVDAPGAYWVRGRGNNARREFQRAGPIDGVLLAVITDSPD